MPSITSQKEKDVLAALVRKFETVSGISNIVTTDDLLDSKQDVIAAVCVRDSDNKTIVKFCQVKYTGWRDSDTDGCDDDPVVFMRYNVHIFQAYTPKRKNGTTPYEDIKILDIELHNIFRAKNRKLYDADSNALPKCESQPLVPVSDIILNDDPLIGSVGYFRDYLLEVECL